MKSIKPGRGPSFMGGFMGIVVAVFGIFWTVIAISMGAGLFAIFGILFIIIAVVQTVFHFKNATGKHRYSAYDITDSNEEPDPFNRRFGDQPQADRRPKPTDNDCAFCPYCGTPVAEKYEYCPKCGEKLP